jgi:predicted naringenin-chalcone synthase
MTSSPRIAGAAAALPAYTYRQDVLCEMLSQRLFGDDWTTRSDVADDVRIINRLFAASRVEQRQTAVDLMPYYSEVPTTGQRMRDYERLAYPLAREALEACLEHAHQPAGAVTDTIVVSCTGYMAPGLDILLARDLEMRPDVRKLVIGHMGCAGGIIGLRTALAALRAHEEAVVALTAVELCSLHFALELNFQTLPGLPLFADAATSLFLTNCEDATGPELIDTYCSAAFEAMDQITWKITDQGFLMGLSRRIPITLRRNVACVIERLLAPHDLALSDISHWLVHPGGPDILEVVGDKLSLSEEQMGLSYEVLRDHGNCSSTTVLLMLNRLIRSDRPRPGEWGVMMAFGPGLTLETCLLRF